MGNFQTFSKPQDLGGVGLIDEHRKNRENREHSIKILYSVLLRAISLQPLVTEQSIAYQNVLNFNKECISMVFYMICVSPIAQEKQKKINIKF